MKREELNKELEAIFTEWQMRDPHEDDSFFALQLESLKLGIRYGINKICEEYIDENGMCLGKYNSVEDIIKELDDKR